MILVFILLTILIVVLAIFFLILTSTIRIEIENFKMSNIKKIQEKEYIVYLSLYFQQLFSDLLFSLKLNSGKLKKIYVKMKLDKLDLKKIEKDLKLDDFKIIKKMKLKLTHFDLKMKLGVESPVITAFLVSIISLSISILLPYLASELKENKYKYIVEPIYQNKNLYKIQFNCIIQAKMVHIISAIYMYLKKGRSDVHERTTSNRRSYGYSYE